MTDPSTHSFLRRLGIDEDYGRDPFRPAYREAAELVEVEENILGMAQRLSRTTAVAWQAMKRTAHQDGIELLLVSGFRSIAHQAELFERKLAAGQTLEQILAVNAAPGFSQHHTGKTVDIATPGARPLTEDFDSTPAFAWLVENAGKFDFRMPYRRDNVFGFSYEPWHWTQIRD